MCPQGTCRCCRGCSLGWKHSRGHLAEGRTCRCTLHRLSSRTAFRVTLNLSPVFVQL